MARRGRIEIEVGLKSEAFFTDLNRMMVRMRSVMAPLVTGYFAKEIGRIGFEFNRAIETSTVGIAAILRQFRPDKYRSVTDAFKDAAATVEQLKLQAMETVDTIQDLVQAHKNLSGLMFKANIPLERQAYFIRVMSNAVRGMGLGARGQQVFQLIEETRALLTGQITRYSVIGQMLFPPGPERERLKTELARGEDVSQFIIKKLSAFDEAGTVMAQTFEGLSSNLFDAVSSMLGDASKPVFESTKKLLADLIDLFKDKDFRASVNELGQLLNDLASRIFPVLVKGLRFVSEWSRELMMLGAGMVGFKLLGGLGRMLPGAGRAAGTFWRRTARPGARPNWLDWALLGVPYSPVRQTLTLPGKEYLPYQTWRRRSRFGTATAAAGSAAKRVELGSTLEMVGSGAIAMDVGRRFVRSLYRRPGFGRTLASLGARASVWGLVTYLTLKAVDKARSILAEYPEAEEGAIRYNEMVQELVRRQRIQEVVKRVRGVGIGWSAEETAEVWKKLNEAFEEILGPAQLLKRRLEEMVTLHRTMLSGIIEPGQMLRWIELYRAVRKQMLEQVKTLSLASFFKSSDAGETAMQRGRFLRASQFAGSQRRDQLLTRMVAALETLAATVAGTRLRVDA